jgi:hypothetical protein
MSSAWAPATGVVLKSAEAIEAAKKIAEANKRKAEADKSKDMVSLSSLIENACPLECCNICLDPEAYW